MTTLQEDETNACKRLKACELELVARGVHDVKFTWAKKADKPSLDELQSSTATFLEAYLAGNYKELKRLDDPVTRACNLGNRED